ncbi:MAG: ribosome recycling factor [Candidatus Sumerlaeia bacterium]|nr:ribosome recycling factor [Candidatus Sumerlaeia bacterium]
MPEAIDKVFKETEEHYTKAIRDLEHQFTTLRTGRANPGLLEGVRVEAYGSAMGISGVASVNAPDAHHLVITPWDKTLLGAIERGILAANIGITPVNDGQVVRLSFPQMTEETRKEITKKAHEMAEKHRVGIRNSRRHAKEAIDALPKLKGKNAVEISEDEIKRAHDKLQKLTDSYIKKVDDVLAKKEKEIMTI